jgi:hypothetical protein
MAPMKILWLYKYIPSYDFDNWLHMKFVEAMDRSPSVQVMAYGPDLHQGYPHLTKLKYNPSYSIHDIQRKFDFDAVILNTKSRMFMDYSPHTGVAVGQWLPRDLSKIAVPRIVIEEDYHYETTDKWYVDNGIDLILQRHWSQSLRQQTVPMKWFPFSVDTSTFHPWGAQPRIGKICFAGSSSPTVYRYRHQACEILSRTGMIDVFARKQKIGPLYPQCLREYVSHLSCSSTYHLSSAKMFEIMASGSALFTNENDDLAHLFAEGSYYTYKRDLSNVESVAREILNNTAGRQATVEKGLVTIAARHTHEKRIGDLVEIIRQIKE